ncbi:PREDICTED: Bardet-Biedl syndrome 2 protein homolog [Ceratosolen solmsi marchali]|uniref:Bardet-Biedl syndrome 2 protein homolog n=1 Tax=Ceratosolen solmsi marchali TaxID=326594 RepID=A0AAJ6YPR6_9HYME|nr:PREDICTED: Bardet-Biedl syndrome 2 protein homolog [Ceratosolen solmsi marchali]
MATFSLNLHRRLEAGFVASGKFDGSHACLTAATSSGNVLVHSPHREAGVSNHQEPSSEARLTWSGELAELQIGKEVTALHTGRLGEDGRDVFFVGTSTHILAYQIEDNADLFYKELPDGAYCITVGKLGWLPNHVVVVGGNCSITVLDIQADEVFWTVAREKVTALAVFDFDGDGDNELLSGTTDFGIRAQKEDAILWDTVENAPVIALHALSEREFAYAACLEGNGTVGVYNSGNILWRIKSKHKVITIRAFDLNGDGAVELLTGWSSGKVDARLCSNGQVIFKVQMGAPIAGLVEADYRRAGKPDLVIVTVAGEVRGYAVGSAMETPELGDEHRELMAKKQALQMELRQRTVAESNYYLGSKLAVSIASARGAVRLGLASGPGLLIYYSMVFAEGIFEGESLVIHPSKPQGELEIALRFPKNGPVDIHVKTCVGASGSDLMMVLELTHQLPQLCMYESIPRPQQLPDGLEDRGVVMQVPERAQRVALWLNQSLILSAEIEVAEVGPKAGHLEVWLRGLRDQRIHCIELDATSKLKIRTEDPVFAGDVVQALAIYLGLRELSSEANFPEEERRMLDALQRFKGYKEVDARLQAETAGSSSHVKNLIVRLEDARILEDIEGMRMRLNQLKIINGDLIRDHEIRSKSYGEFVGALKELNVGIQNASRFRVGKAATSTVQRCREAIKEENEDELISAIRHN